MRSRLSNGWWRRVAPSQASEAAYYVLAGLIVLGVMQAVTLAQVGREADDLWPASLAHDVLSGTPVHGWQLPPAPIYFPEQLSVLFWMALGLDVNRAYVAYGMAAWMIVACLISWGARVCGADTKSSAAAAAVQLMFYAIVSRGGVLTGPLTNPGSHGGAFLCTLLWLVFLGDALQFGFRRVKSIATTVVLGLCVASDLTVLGHLVVPSLLVVGIFWRAKWVSTAPLLFALALLVLGSAVGLLLPSVVTWATGTTVSRLRFDTSWDLFILTASNFVWDMRQLSTSHPVLFWANIVCLTLSCSRVISRAPRLGATSKSGRVNRVGAWWIVCAGLAMTTTAPLAAMVTNKWGGLGTARYVLPFLLLPSALVTMTFAARFAPSTRGLRRRLELAALACGVLVARSSSSGDYVDQHPPSAEELAHGRLGSASANQACLEGEVARLGLHAGYASYWFARPSMVLGELHPTVVPLTKRLGLRRWINNTFWYTRGYQPDTERVMRYDFLIANELDERWIVDRFGEPRMKRQCFRLAIWVYDRPTDFEFRNYIRSEAALLTGDRTGWWDSPDLPSGEAKVRTAVIDGHAGATFRFPRIPAMLLEIVSLGRTPLQLGFVIGGVEVARQIVDFGLDSRRLLALPTAVRGKLDAITVRSLKAQRVELQRLTLMDDAGVDSVEFTHSRY